MTDHPLGTPPATMDAEVIEQAAETPMADHLARFWRHIAENKVHIVVSMHRPDSFGGLGHWDTASFPDDVAKALTAEAATLRAEVERLTNERDNLKLQARCHAQEARTANATIYESYQAITGARGEPGNWNGAEPVRALVAERDALRSQLESMREAEREACAQVAEAHKGAAAKKRRTRPNIVKFASDEAKVEIFAEERGEDIAAEIIARNIRARAALSETEALTTAESDPK